MELLEILHEELEDVMGRRTQTHKHIQYKRKHEESINWPADLSLSLIIHSHHRTQPRLSLTLELSFNKQSLQHCWDYNAWLNTLLNKHTYIQMVLVQQPQQPENTQFTHTLSVGIQRYLTLRSTPNGEVPLHYLHFLIGHCVSLQSQIQCQPLISTVWLLTNTHTVVRHCPHTRIHQCESSKKLHSAALVSAAQQWGYGFGPLQFLYSGSW